MEEDLKSIQLAVDLSWQRLGLMERRGFKVVSMLRQCWDLVAVAKEWNLQDTLDQVVARGAHLAQVEHTCHLSPVTCQLSPVTCHLSPVTPVTRCCMGVRVSR